MALASEEREWARLPGELPPAFRRRHVHSHHTAQRGLCTSSDDGLAAEVYPHGLQENQQAEDGEEKGDLFKVIDRLDDVIQRLMKSCKVKPDIDSDMDTGASVVEESFSSRELEGRLDQIIERLSQSGYFSRPSKDLCANPSREHLANEKPECSSTAEGLSRVSPSRTCGILGNAHDDHITTPTSSFRMPLLTPRCLLSKLGSSEKVDVSASPTTVGGRLSSGRSGRFSAALSFLVSPRRAGSLSSSSPKPSDMER